MKASVSRALQAIGVNAVPAWGFFGEGWSDATTLTVYWVESLLTIPLVASRIALHRKLTRKRGHEYPLTKADPKPGQMRSIRRAYPALFLKNFLLIGIAFTVVHGIFLAVILGLLLPKLAGREAVLDFEAIKTGVTATTAFLLVGWVTDLLTIREKPFAWIRRLGESMLGRVGMTHFVIIFGMVALAWTNQPRMFFSIFIVLKTLADLGSSLPMYEPKEAPKWLTKAMNKVGDGKEDFATYWKEGDEIRDRQRAEDEEVLPV